LPPKINLNKMQIIQSIKDRGGVIMAILIAIALISFILMDSKSGSGNGSFTKPSIGKINGNSVESTEFETRVKAEETKQAQQNGKTPTGVELMRLRDQLWNQIVAENIFYPEAEKLGITLTPQEFTAILKSNDPSNPFKQERGYGMLDANGNIDEAKVTEAIKTIKGKKSAERLDIDSRIIDPLRLTTTATKYSGLINAAAYYPTWMEEKDLAEGKNFATISYVAVPFSEISDSAVIVKDDDITSYVSKRKDMFKQEAGRTVSFVSFSQLPTLADSALAKKQVEDLKESFITDSTSAKIFLAKNGSSIDFKDEYVPLSRMAYTKKDTITKQAVNAVFGPFVEGDNYAYSKILGTKQMPDSVKARHILIALNDRETGKEIRVDSVGKKLADSIFAAVNLGANFAALAAQYSADPNKDKGGDLGTFGYGGSYPGEFNEFCFSGTAGQKKVVKSQVGYQIIEIVKQDNFKTAYKIAVLAKPIIASQETFNAASQAATKAAATGDAKAFIEYAKKNGLKLVESPATIKENDFTVGSMQDARTLVRWMFDAKVGDVSNPLSIGDDQVVAVVNKIYAEGTQDATTARPMAEAAVRNQKKGEMIAAKLATATTLEAAATAYNKQVAQAGADSSITMNGSIIQGLGQEPKIIGAAFNKEYLTKASTPIVGTSAVYVIKVNAIQPTVEQTQEKKAAQKITRIQAIRQKAGNWFEALRKQANITDNRSKFF
jgi:peptidyl-prolyl cis-trans isomerase D